MGSFTSNETDSIVTLYNHVNECSGHLYQAWTQQKILDCASRSKFIVFPHPDISSVKECALYPAPNVFLKFNDEINCDMNGRANCLIGIAFNARKAMKKLHEILNSEKGVSFINSVNSLGYEWMITITQKFRASGKSQFQTIDCFGTHTATIEKIKKAINFSDYTCLKKGSKFNDRIVLWCITTFRIVKKCKIASFDVDVKTVFDLFKGILSYC